MPEVDTGCPTEARERKIRSTAMPLALDQHNMAGLRGFACRLAKTLNELLNDDDSSSS